MPARIEDCRDDRPIRRRGVRGAFTLIEVMVAVGAIALVAVGLAAIFDAVGKTVSGGRRTSTLNNYAALLETQLRRDFDAMTRDSFLVIRQQWTDGVAVTTAGGAPDGTFDPDEDADTVPLYSGDPTPRGRRIDEILFFARTTANNGFRSRNQPIVPGLTVTSESAMIYLGHGQQGREGSGDSYLDPQLDDLNDDGNALLGLRGDPTLPPELRNPNYFASNWILVRRATLLVPQNTTLPFEISATPPFGLRGEQPFNKDSQVSLLPASASIFRSYNRAFPLVLPDDSVYVRGLGDNAETGPMLASGLVDIATTDLTEIRQIAMTSVGPSSTDGLPRDIVRDTGIPRAPSGNFDFTAPLTPPPNQRPSSPTSLDRQHSWFADALPTQSDPLPAIGNDYPANFNDDPRGVRIRCEPQALNLLAALAEPDPLDSITARADQMMLTSSNLLPHCSEFIVEWSFGQVENGEVLWFGPERRLTDSNGSGDIDLGDIPVTTPYPKFPTTLAEPRLVVQAKTNDGSVLDHNVSQHLVYGRRVRPDDAVMTSYFGYIDPTVNPDTDPGDADGDGDPLNDPGDLVTGVPWAWPKLIRITVSLTDPIDRRIESTFQFIFKVPTQ